MGQTSINLTRCLFRYQNTSCTKCQEICPKQAISLRQVNPELCDSCGLCTAICPVGAIETRCSYEKKLNACRQSQEPLLLCQKALPERGFACLGFLDRRLLWAMASGRQLEIDISRCEACNPQVYAWLSAELDACNAALREADQPQIAYVHVEPKAPEERTVSRRNFFRELFGAAVQTAEVIARPLEEGAPVFFDEAQWIRAQQPVQSRLFPQLQLVGDCNGCGMCGMICPEKAITVEQSETRLALHFDPFACKACGLCSAHCAREALTLEPQGSQPDGFELVVELPRCKSCGKPFRPIGDADVCLECHQKQGMFGS